MSDMSGDVPDVISNPDWMPRGLPVHGTIERWFEGCTCAECWAFHEDVFRVLSKKYGLWNARRVLKRGQERYLGMQLD